MNVYDAVHKIKGLNIRRAINIKNRLMMLDEKAADFAINVPLVESYKNRKNDSVNIDQSDGYELNDNVFQAFSCLNIERFRWFVELPDEMRGSDSHSYFSVNIDMLRMNDDFEDVFRSDVFEGANKRDMYNNWGAGGYKFEYESAINWRYQSINDRQWLCYRTEREGCSVKDKSGELFFNETFTAPVTKNHILKINFNLSLYCDSRARESILKYIVSVQKFIMKSVFLELSDEQSKKYSISRDSNLDIKPSLSHEKTVWIERPLPYIGDIADELGVQEALIEPDMSAELNMFSTDYSGYYDYLDDSLIYSPFNHDESNAGLEIPVAKDADNPVIKEAFRKQKKLAEQMRKTLSSHLVFSK